LDALDEIPDLVVDHFGGYLGLQAQSQINHPHPRKSPAAHRTLQHGELRPMRIALASR
jgi:23S rRNA G2069 N7-methylase RlmK/C1962 C5-methylase RlmI